MEGPGSLPQSPLHRWQCDRTNILPLGGPGRGRGSTWAMRSRRTGPSNGPRLPNGSWPCPPTIRLWRPEVPGSRRPRWCRRQGAEAGPGTLARCPSRTGAAMPRSSAGRCPRRRRALRRCLRDEARRQRRRALQSGSGPQCTWSRRLVAGRSGTAWPSSSPGQSRRCRRPLRTDSPPPGPPQSPHAQPRMQRRRQCSRSAGGGQTRTVSARRCLSAAMSSPRRVQERDSVRQPCCIASAASPPPP
mmetsp:Transcript_56891/g.166599  ORF Transcript_56891/g.166599 Transcript_56891/m.166599 type:complete len:245 (-) Transcript_56891:148-882(-)